MGTTINGTYIGGKRQRRIVAMKGLQEQLKISEKIQEKCFNEMHNNPMKDEDFIKTKELFDFTSNNIKRIFKETNILKERI